MCYLLLSSKGSYYQIKEINAFKKNITLFARVINPKNLFIEIFISPEGIIKKFKSYTF